MTHRNVEHVCVAVIPKTPLGDLWLATSTNGLVAVGFDATPLNLHAQLERRFKSIQTAHLSHQRQYQSIPPGGIIASLAVSQIEEYLSGKLRDFTIPIDWTGMSVFQSKTLQATIAIPYGKTKTYGQIALEIGHPRSARAVGRAQATNPMPILIPCHRVVGGDGALHGYSGRGGIQTKAWLLALETST